MLAAFPSLHAAVSLVAVGVPAAWALYNARALGEMWLHAVMGAVSSFGACGLLVLRGVLVWAVLPFAVGPLLLDITFFGYGLVVVAPVTDMTRVEWWTVFTVVLALCCAAVADVLLIAGVA